MMKFAAEVLQKFPMENGTTSLTSIQLSLKVLKDGIGKDLNHASSLVVEGT